MDDEEHQLEPCGCPSRIVSDEGHQEGCDHAERVAEVAARVVERDSEILKRLASS